MTNFAKIDYPYVRIYKLWIPQAKCDILRKKISKMMSTYTYKKKCSFSFDIPKNVNRKKLINLNRPI